MCRLAASSILTAVIVLTGCVQIRAQEVLHFYSIAGDVAEPQTYQWPASHTVCVRDLIQRAGTNNPDVTAIILRGPHLTPVAADRVSPVTSGRGAQLSNGDIVILHRHGSGNIPQTSNALVLLNAVPDVLPFSGSSLPLSALLDQIESGDAQQVLVTRTVSGNVANITLNRNDPILHGDIVHLAQAISDAGYPAEVYATLPAALQDNSTDTAYEAAEDQFIDTAATDDPATEEPMLTIPGGSFSGDSEGSAVSLNEPDTTSQLQPLPALSVNDNSDFTDHGNVPVHSASLQEELVNDSQQVEPTAKESAATGETGIWNIIFVCGLLFALGLIAVGWLKTQQERDLEQQLEQTMRGNFSRPQHAATPALVADQDDDHSPSTDVREDCPVLSAGMEEQAEDRAKHTNVANDLPESVVAHSPVQPADTASAFVLDTHESFANGESWFAGDWALVDNEPASQPENTVPVEHNPVDDETAVQNDSAESIPKNAGDPTDRTSQLEDLIQNRVPVQRSAISLPLKVSLFGRPAGPRRLRIDAAHTELAAPHMLKKERRSRRPETKVAAGRQAPPESKSESEASVSRFDRALNYLEEQSES